MPAMPHSTKRVSLCLLLENIIPSPFPRPDTTITLPKNCGRRAVTQVRALHPRARPMHGPALRCTHTTARAGTTYLHSYHPENLVVQRANAVMLLVITFLREKPATPIFAATLIAQKPPSLRACGILAPIHTAPPHSYHTS